MGLCPSRNTKAKSQTFTPLEPAPTPKNFSLRADAEAFTPKAEPKEKEAWEQFLDQKQKQQLVQPKGKTFARKVDGTYTADYRRLLGDPQTERPRQKYVPPQQRGESTDCDWIKEWKETKKPRPAPGLSKPKATPAPGPMDSDAKLKAALHKVKQQALPKDAALEQLAQLQAALPKDDLETPSALVPFGLTDHHYLSDSGDTAGSHRHCSSIQSKPRPYAKPPTPALEASMTHVLHDLRQLRSAEQHSGLEQAGRRYCVGIREVARMLKDKQNCCLKAVLVAPDVEPDCKTVRGSLDARLNELIQNATALNIPVVFGLSRTRLGQAVKKNVTISVLGIMSTRGMQAPFEQMLRDAA